MEQLAGDELVGATHANAQGLANADEDAREKLTATGFLRLAPDGTGSSPMDAALARKDAVTGTVNIVSSALLGMTIGCAECHDHRFDPIPQVDFYRLRAVFAPVFDSTNWRTPQLRRAALLSPEDKAKGDQLELQAKQLNQEHDQLKEETVRLVFQRVLETIPEERRELAIQTFDTPAGQRTEEQKRLFAEQFPMLNVRAGTLHLFLARYEDGDALKAKYEKVLEQANELRAQKPQPTFIRIATEDPKKVPVTHVFYGGDLNSPEPDPVKPGGGLSVLSNLVDATFAEDDPKLPTTGRRLALAYRAGRARQGPGGREAACVEHVGIRFTAT